MIETDYEIPLGLSGALSAAQDSRLLSRSDVRSPTSTKSDVRSPTSTRTEVRSPTSTRTEVRSPTRTATEAYTQGNFTSTVTGGAGAGATYVTINVPDKKWKRMSAGAGKPSPEQSPWGFDVNKDAVDAATSNPQHPFGFDISKDSSDGSLYSGGSSYAQGLSYLGSSAGLSGFQSPLCQRDVLASLGNFKANLAGFDDAMNQDVIIDSIKAIAQAVIAGGNAASAIAKKLNSQSSSWMKIANDRFSVVKIARDAYSRLKAQVEDLDRKVATSIASNKGKEAEALRKDSVNKAKLALQYQKVNALSTELADNAMAQSSILQQMAAAAATGKYYDLDHYNVLYQQFVANSKKASDLRKKQLATLPKNGLSEVRKPFIDYFEEELNGLSSLRHKRKKKLNTVFNGYSMDVVQPGFQRSEESMFKPVGSALSGAATKTAIVTKKVMKKATPPKKPLPPRVVVRKPVARRAVPINTRQIARQGTGAATAALMANNIKGITPEQLTALTRQAEALVAGSGGSASSIIAQARQV